MGIATTTDDPPAPGKGCGRRLVLHAAPPERGLAAAEFPAADTVDLTISRMPHPAMPDGVLADMTALTPDGVHRVRGVGRTPQAAIDQVRAHLAARR